MTYYAAGFGLGGAALGAATSGNNMEHIGTDELYPDWMQGDVKNLAQNIPNLQDRQSYQGDWTAGMNPMMEQNIADQYGFGQQGGAGYNAANNMMGAGNNMLGAGQQGMDYMQGMQNRGPNQFQYDQNTYDQSFGNLSGGMQGAFDQGAQQMQQGFDWGALPGLNMQGALGGQNGSTKQYQQGALGQAMTNQNIQNFGTNMWQNAANQANQGAMNAGQLNLSSANGFDQNMVNNYGRYAQQGANMLGQGYDMSTNNLGLGQNAGGLQQSYNQSVADSNRAQWDQDQNQPWMDQQDRTSLTKSWANNNPYQDAGMSPWEGALQGAQSGLALYGMGQGQGLFGGGGTFDPNQAAADADWGPGGFSGGSAWDESF